MNNAKEPVGYSIDLCKRVVNSIQKQLGLDSLKVEWVPVTVNSRFSAVASGKTDMECGSSTVTFGRMKEVDFSYFIFVETTGVVVSRTSNIRSIADMGGRKIAVVADTTNERSHRDADHAAKARGGNRFGEGQDRGRRHAGSR